MEITNQDMPEYQASNVIEPVITPIGQDDVGEDPRYGEGFIEVKNEIDKLSNTDYEKVGRICERILTYESKDLRIAGYYLLAKTYTEGLEGLLLGVERYLSLVKAFGNRCHPQRKNAKLQAIEWLNNDKFTVYIERANISTELDYIVISKLKLLIDELNSIFILMHGDEVATWTTLNPWFKKNSATNQKTNDEIVKKDVQDSTANINQTREILNEQMFLRASSDLFDYLSKKHDLIRLIAMARSLKWSALTLPSNENGTTKLNPPRESVIKKTDNTSTDKVTEEELNEMEACFLESGCQFFFDLQKAEVDLAHKIGRTDIVDLIEKHISILVQREPEIVHLSYSDGTPFANEQTRWWINGLNQESIINVDSKGTEETLKSRIDLIISESRSLTIEQSIEALDQLEVKDGVDIFRINLAKIEICILGNRHDVALPLAEHLEKKIEHHHLVEWDRTLALALWRKLLQLFKSKSGDKVALKRRIDEIKSNICKTDVKYALGLWKE